MCLVNANDKYLWNFYRDLLVGRSYFLIVPTEHWTTSTIVCCEMWAGGDGGVLVGNSSAKD